MRTVPRLCEFYPGICLTTEEKAWKNLSQGSRRVLVYILPNTHTLQNLHTHTHTHTLQNPHTHTHQRTKTRLENQLRIMWSFYVKNISYAGLQKYDNFPYKISRPSLQTYEYLRYNILQYTRWLKYDRDWFFFFVTIIVHHSSNSQTGRLPAPGPAGLDGRKISPHRDSIPGPSSP